MNQMTQTLTSLMDEPVQKPLMRDGIWAVMGWKDLQARPIDEEPRMLFWMALLVMLSFIVPVLAWSAESFNVPVLKHQLQRGSVITADDIKMTSLPHAPSPQVITVEADLVGKEVFRNVRAGMPVFDSHVRVPPTVRKNALVDLIVSMGAIEITGSGKALEDAMTGNAVKVINTDSGQVIAGVVQADGSVKIQ